MPQDLAFKLGSCVSLGRTMELVDMYANHSVYHSTQLVVINTTLSILKGEVVNDIARIT